MSKITDVGAVYDPQFERIEMTDKLRAAAQFALETLEDVFGKDKIDVGAINNLRAALAETQMPTKICGPNLEETLNAAGFYRKKEWVGLTDEEIEALASWWPSYEQMPALKTLIKDVTNSLKEKNS